MIGTRRTVFVVPVAIVLIGELIAASAFALPAARRAHPWPLSIAVVGDSYTAGSHNRVVWPTLLAQRTGWSVSNFALPGAGFAADGGGGHAFTYQVDRAQGARVRIILIVGGLADDGLADTGPVTVGAIDTINKIKVGGQRALVVGPTWYETPVPDSVKRVSNAVRKVAEKAGVPYLDALDPPWLTRDLMDLDLSGPTDEGQSVIADKIAAWLRTEVAG
ncbi:MAG TPA: SGNH/GDSL hydrolase family protein [Mycobacterium sp.]|nr:SGNH/GDSL hydrolase family protein [Mycobacterium sp.]